MILRLIVLLSACVGLAGRAGAVPVWQLQLSPLVHTVEEQSDQCNVWRAPQSSLKTFPFLSQEDCDRYGRQAGYSECLDGRPEKPASLPAQTPKPPAPPRQAELALPPVALEVPLPARRATALAAKAASPVRSGFTTAEETTSAAVALVDDSLARTGGSLLVVGFEGRSAADEGPKRIANALREGRLGGVLLRRANIESAAQLKALTAFLSRGLDQQPLILIEHPGGPGDALASAAGFQPVAAPREVGQQGDALEAFTVYQQMAEILAVLGVSLNVGPSAAACPPDASADAMDCFGSDPRHSAAFATAFALAHQSRGVLTAMPYRAASEEDGAALSEMAKRKAPDVLIVGAKAQGASAAKTASALRPVGFQGAILLDGADQQDAAERLVDALSRDADMVLFRTARGLEAGLPETALVRIRSAINAGRLTAERLDDAASNAASLREQLQASQSRVVFRAGAGGEGNPAR